MAKQLVIIGGGAAGYFCAVNAAAMDPAWKITLLEKSSKVLSKVKVSGGGRCNVTHACDDIVEMSRQYPRGENFVKRTFNQFFVKDTINWFEKRAVKLKTESDGRMFPESNSSQTIIDCLVKEAAKHGVEIMLNRDVQRLRRNENGWELTVRTGREEQLIKADAVCIACGGFPKSSMFDWIRELGHTIVDPVPSLFTFNLSDKKITELMGASSQAIVRIKGAASKSLKEEGPLLFTHWGMSGPVILRLSAWGARELAALDYDFTIGVNWLPDHTEPGLRGQFQEMRHSLATQQIGTKHPFGLPQRFWKYLLAESGINESMRWADLPSKNQNLLIKNLSDGEFDVKGKTTFKEEFVTSGGVELKEVDANTMMSRKQPQLYFAGEILDVDGITGGYNFQHAWTSGYIAARAITGTV